MRKQPFFLSFLLVIHSFNLTAQPKNKYADYFNQPHRESGEIREERSEYAPNGVVNIYAVVVGVGDYSAMPKLQYTGDDARLFYEHLQSEEGGALPANQIRLLVDEDATRKNILHALRKLSAKADGNDVFIFYFSGHGINGAFLPVDFDGFNNQLSHREVLQILENSNAKHKLCIADACFSGALDFNENLVAKGGYSGSTSRFFEAFEQAERGTALLMSSSANETSLEDRRLQHGVFTHFLLRGMGGKADFDHNRIVDIKELFHYTYHKVAEHTEGAQSPVLTGDYDEEMPVAMGR